MELYIVCGVIAFVVLAILGIYNRLIRLKNRVKQSRSGIDVYLRQRFDLIPNLVECVKGYAQHEKDVLDSIAKLRTNYQGAEDKNFEHADELNNAIKTLIGIAEGYPNLKASEQYLNLQKNLSKTESQLQAARRIYNNDVTNYNIAIERVPNNLVANIFKFEPMRLFEIEENVKENINLESGKNI